MYFFSNSASKRTVSALALLLAAGLGLQAQSASADTEVASTPVPDFTNSIAISADGSIIAYSDQTNNKVHFLTNNLLETSSSQSFTDPYNLVIDPTNTFAYVGQINGQAIQTVRISDGTTVGVSTTGYNTICMRLSPDSLFTITCENIRIVKRLTSDLQNGVDTNTNHVFTWVIVDAAISPDGTTIYAAESGGDIDVLDSSLQVTQTWPSPVGSNPIIRLSPDGTLLAVGGTSATKILGSNSGSTVVTLPNFLPMVYSPNGEYIYGIEGTDSETVVVAYQVSTWRKVTQNAVANAYGIVFHPSGNYYYIRSGNSYLSAPMHFYKFAVGPAITFDALAATSSSSDLAFRITADVDIDCSTLSTAIGVDFDASGVATIDTITQSGPSVCTINATSSATPGGSPTTATLTAAQTFSIAATTTGWTQSTFMRATQSETVVTLSSPTTTVAPTTTTLAPTTTSTHHSTTTVVVSESTLPPTGSRAGVTFGWIVAVLTAGLALLTARRRVA